MFLFCRTLIGDVQDECMSEGEHQSASPPVEEANALPMQVSYYVTTRSLVARCVFSYKYVAKSLTNNVFNQQLLLH